MKKLLLYVSVILVTVSGLSCKKDSEDTPAYYLKFKLDGEWINYKSAMGELGPDLADPTLTDFVVNASSDDDKEIFSIAIQVDGGQELGTGSYATDNTSYWATMDWMTGANTGDMRVFDVEDAPGMAPSKYIIKITSITDKELRGTFTGNYLYDYWANDPNDAVRNITEGEFVALRIP